MTRPLERLSTAVRSRPVPWARTATVRSPRGGPDRRITPHRYRTWKRSAVEILAGAAGWRTFDPASALEVEITVYPDGVTVDLSPTRFDLGYLDRRAGLRGDIDNYAKAVLDALQDADVIADDRQIVALSVRFGEADR